MGGMNTMMGMNPMMGMMNPMMMGMGGMGGWGKGGKMGWSENPAVNAPPHKKVFIGNLPTLGKEGLSKELNKKLMEQFKQAGACKYAEIGKNGTGVAVFATKEDAEAAVTTMNGTVFEGQAVTVSAWGGSRPDKGK